MTSEIMPDSRVLVFDYLLFRDDRSTPLSETMRPATVVRRYGCTHDYGTGGPVKYPDLVDVVFDHRPGRESVGHFTDRVKSLPEYYL